MADATPTPSQHGPAEKTINIAIKSPGIETPVKLEETRIRTTVGDLKTAIRDKSPNHPAESRQRLIFQGRPLLRDDQTLVEALGESAIRDQDTVIIHVALRDLPEAQHQPLSSSRPSPVSGFGAPRTANTSTSVPTSSRPHPNNSPTSHPQGQPLPRAGVQPQGPPGGAFPLNIPAAMQQQQRQFMAQWAASVHREGLNRQAAHNQQMRAAANAGNQSSPFPGGYANISPLNTPPTNAETPRGRSSPGPGLQPGVTRTIVREGVSPNGTRWRLVNHQTNPIDANFRLPGAGGLTPQGMQNLFRGPDASQAAHSTTNRMQRSASSTSLPSGHLPHLSGTPRLAGSRPLSRAGTPDLGRLPPFLNMAQPGPTLAGQSQQAPEVYLLQSPQGPRALLFNGSAGSYYASGMPLYPTTPFYSNSTSPFSYHIPGVAGPSRPQQPTYGGAAAAAQGARQRRNRSEQAGADAARQQNPARRRRARNPRVAVERAVAIARWWEHIWLLARLGLFIWWFTSPDTSWTRWIALVSMALAIFVINTRILEGVGEQAWAPIRRHFENLLPLNEEPVGAEPLAQGVVPQGAEGQEANRHNQAAGEPRPADMAARLIDQRRQANENWIQDQIRRVERASLLFLASLAPGIAERHIRNFERAQERIERERERREAEANAAAEGDDNDNAPNHDESSGTSRQDGTSTENEHAQSTGVDTTANASGELRERNNERAPANSAEVAA